MWNLREFIATRPSLRDLLKENFPTESKGEAAGIGLHEGSNGVYENRNNHGTLSFSSWVAFIVFYNCSQGDTIMGLRRWLRWQSTCCRSIRIWGQMTQHRYKRLSILACTCNPSTSVLKQAEPWNLLVSQSSQYGEVLVQWEIPSHIIRWSNWSVDIECWCLASTSTPTHPPTHTQIDTHTRVHTTHINTYQTCIHKASLSCSKGLWVIVRFLYFMQSVKT